MHKLKAIVCLAFISIVSIKAVAQTTDPDHCAIDIGLELANAAANELAAQEVEQFMKPSQSKPSERACLPTLAGLGAGLSATIPSFGNLSGAIFAKIRDAACRTLDNAIGDAANKAQAGWEAPYGLGGVSLGASTDGSGVNAGYEEQEVYILQNIVDDVSKGVSNTINDAGANISSDVDQIININRGGTEEKNRSWESLRQQVTEGL